MNTMHAPFFVTGRWVWHIWSHNSDMHAAIVAKATELGATAWDTSQASHAVRGSCVFGHPTLVLS